MCSCAILFVKNPVPGQVKTRLQPRVCAAAAAELCRAFALDSAETLAATRVDRRVVAYAPAAAREDVIGLLAEQGPFDFVPQPEGNLGERMERLMRESLEGGAGRTIILGSDCPSLPPAMVEQALELLRTRALVLGPSTDGGYYLIGQSRPLGEVFRGVSWSTGAVLDQTLASLAPGLELGRGRRSLKVLRGLDLPVSS